MRVLVTGSNGQVGIELCQFNPYDDIDVIGVDRSELDITDRRMVFRKAGEVKPDVIINAAAYTAVDKAEDDTELAQAVNRDGSAFLAEFCAECDIPLIHISTDYVFDGSKEGAYNEMDPVAPINAYGRTKENGEAAIRDIFDNHVILRTSWVFSAHRSNFVKSMLRLAEQRDELNIVGDQSGGPTSAKSIAATCLQISSNVVREGNNNRGTYHYSGVEPTNWCDFAKAIIQRSGQLVSKNIQINAITTEEYPTPAARPRNSVLNCAKIRSHFDIEQPNWLLDLDDVLNSI